MKREDLKHKILILVDPQARSLARSWYAEIAGDSFIKKAGR